MNNDREKEDRGRELNSVKRHQRSTNKSTTERITGSVTGDALRLEMETNDRQLEIIGDGCRLTIVNNHGSIKMIGDGGRLEIIGENSGVIQYHGDGGRIILPDTVNSTTNLVHYYGDGGKVKVKKIHNKVAMIQKKNCDVTKAIINTGISRTPKCIILDGVKQKICSSR